MLRDLKGLLFTDTGKDTTVVFAGTLANVVIGGLFFIFAPRILGPEDYGLFSVVTATGLMAVNFANFGIDTGILKFVSDRNQDQRNKILKLAFKAYSFIGALTFLIGLLFSGIIAAVLGVAEIANLLKIAFAGVIFLLLTNFLVAALQSGKRFLEASMINISSNVARILILALGAYFFTINLYFLTALFFFVTLVSIVVGKFFLPFDFLKANQENLNFKNFMGFNFWVAASLAISSIPFDNYFLIKIAGPVATGLYAAPMKVLTTTYQFAGGFSRVLASRFSSFDTNAKALEFSKKASPAVILIFALLIASSFLAPFLTTVFGEQFRNSIPVFRILAIGMAFFFAGTIPMSLILYYFGSSKIAFLITLWHYALYILLLFFLIPNYQTQGAALAFTASEIVTFITLVTYVVYRFTNGKR